MRRSITLVLLGLLFTAPSIASAQVAPGINTPFGPLERTLVGIEVIKAQIADLRRQLAACDGPGASKPAICASRALLQAKLNYLLWVGAYLGDPDAAGTPPPKPIPKPSDTTSDYEAEIPYLRQQLQQEVPPRFYLMSETRAKLQIIGHCEQIKDRNLVMSALMSQADQEAARADLASGKKKAAVTACIKEYDAKEIVANRKTALEYCLQATTQKDGLRPLFNLCLQKHDMLHAMCKQRFEFQVALEHRLDPPKPHQPVQCPLADMRLAPSEMRAIMAAPPVPAMAILPAKFFAPPDVVIPPRPPFPIPAGTVVELSIVGSWYGASVDGVEGAQYAVGSLDQPLVIGGKTLLDAHTGFNLRVRIIGLDDPVVRPDTVKIGFTIDEVRLDRLDAQGQPHCPCDRYADVKSNELVFTVSYEQNGTRPGVLYGTKLRFTIGASGTAETPSAPPTAGGRRGAAPPSPTAPPTPTAPTPQAPAAPDPQQRAEEARKRTERVQACVQKAVLDNPAGGLALTLAVSACTQAK